MKPSDNAPAAPSRPSAPEILVVGVDDSPLVPLVLDAAAELGRARAPRVVHLVHAVDDTPLVAVGPLVGPLDLDRRRELAEERLREASRHLAARLAVSQVLHAPFGAPAREVVRVAEEVDATLVVVGTHGRTGAARVLLGSVAEAIVRHAPCPVFVARPLRADGEPKIEPPCPDCVEVRRASGDAGAWCARHSEHHVHARLHYAYPAPFARGSSFVRSE